MADSSYFREYAVFSTRKLDGPLPPRCTVCGANPSLFEYQKQTSRHQPVRIEIGSCCTACAFSMLLQLAQTEAREWTALASPKGSRGAEI